ncbi:gluconate 2-dehydrogenase subunit 3 family protein [Thiomicrorhabdus sp.]|uniref:gluconate 2-dehydrogenase subunit 3 family protein n=1 Tax=Thiomicrorhabdus sp. TaxID=2039724 RepID=UPI0029C99110|nr:gluconate 2-dehydrogenase subunit 3 family protein [Thiomicrorhabdus sp.]
MKHNRSTFFDEFQLSRRRLLQLAATIPLAKISLAQAEGSALSAMTKQEAVFLNNPAWQTVQAVQNHLFPSMDGFPGAEELHALSYLQSKFQRPLADKDSENFIYQGVGWLNDLAKSDYKQKFTALTFEQKEALLRKVSKSRAGQNWLSMMLNNLLEALLTDPVYGGNPNGKGWKAAGQIPGYPLPAPGKRYFEIGYEKRKVNTYRRTKA